MEQGIYITLNRSPSTDSFSVPPISFIRFSAMERPSPEPPAATGFPSGVRASVFTSRCRFVIPSALQQCVSALRSNSPYRISHHIRGMLLHQVGFYKKPRLTAAAPTDNHHIFIPSVLRFFTLPFIVKDSVFVRITFSLGFGSINGSISFLVPHRAEPYSMFFLYFFAFLPLTFSRSHRPPEHIAPNRISDG